ncbi:thermonuclease family protein [Paeniglutamicibacter sp. Y32M11]|uniref:thermonuclease family protein n=1 Tax=Paeniglutamicibacter sp. Y32M11 TaxID=2853258 RepID=UPI001C532C27|nr:thermonuclease family protein [Paeniglutamicibacter sp. Y32M11]QXQ08900.1 thermonuclease family protein [Paeniglutamicibacter sp. Y32M11]
MGFRSERVSVGRLGTMMLGLAVVSLGATACTQAAPPAADGSAAEATIIRVIDGDTVVATVSGKETTVRLLNIDTPETKAPNRPVQCLGNEATTFTESMLRPGDKVTLEYDVTRLDQYGRTLAGVYKDKSLVNADIAAAGLGVAVLFEPNDRFYAEVLAAQEEAEGNNAGLFAKNIECTVPALADTVVEGLSELSDTVPATAADVDSSLAVVTAAIAVGKAKTKTLRALADSSDVAASVVWAVKKGSYTALINSGMERATRIKTKLVAKQAALVQAKKDKAAEAARAKAKAEAKAEAKAQAQAEAERTAVVKAAAEREAAAQRAAEREAAAARAAERRRQAAPPTTYRAPVKEQKDSGGGSYPGYTGPRCYAPGGQSWKPCK